MAQRIVPGPSLTAVAAPVDRFVAPVRKEVGEDPMLQLARVLERVNPDIQSFLSTRYGQLAGAEAAAGARLESQVDPSVALDKNREGWTTLVAEQRKRDKELGTNHADSLAAASPHFRRGMIKARTQRIGITLDDQLQALYSRNPTVEVGGRQVQLHDVDDPRVVAQWTQGVINQIAEAEGINNMDPVLAAEVFNPLSLNAADRLLSVHTGLRLDRYQTEYVNEMSAGVGIALKGYATGGASEPSAFLDRLAAKGESSIDGWDATNSADGSGGKGHYGRLQFSRGRFAEAKAAGAVPAGMTIEQFATRTPEGIAAQKSAELWHINNIDKFIQSNGWLDKGYSLDGMRAVAHLGGKNGLKRFIESGGAYDKDDSYTLPSGKVTKGTHLSDYYRRFAGSSGAVQHHLNQAVKDGVNPTKANETIVEAVIASALDNLDATHLDTLMDVDTGNGKLGNIGWVRAKVTATQERIDDLKWKHNEREYTQTERERSERKTLIYGEGLRVLFDDPEADISDLVTAANVNGNPELARSLHDYQQALQQQAANVTPDGVHITDLRIKLSTGELRGEDFYKAVMEGVTEGKFGHSVALQLMDDADNSGRYADLYSDRQVQDEIVDFGRVVREANSVLDDAGNRVSGVEQGYEAESYLKGQVVDWIKENPEGTVPELRSYIRSEANRLIKSQRYHPRNVVDGYRDGPAPVFGERTAEEVASATAGVADDAPDLTEIFTNLLRNPEETLAAWGEVGSWSPSQMKWVNIIAETRGMSAKDFLEQHMK